VARKGAATERLRDHATIGVENFDQGRPPSAAHRRTRRWRVGSTSGQAPTQLRCHGDGALV